MHPSNNPGIAIVTPSLNNTSVHSWSRSIKLVIRSKKRLGFLDGTLIRPDFADRTALAWDHCNTMVMAWLTNSVELEIVESVL